MIVSPHLHKAAKVVSVIGHPLVILPLIFSALAFRQLPVEKAVLASTVLIGAVILPIAWHNYHKVKRGQYINFDLSNQTQRAGFYPILLLFCGFFSLFLVSTNLYQPFNRGAVCLFMLLAGSYAINFFLKVSLHAAISFFLACALYSLDESLGVVMALFSVLVAVSRLVLKRHSLPEIITGVLAGLVAGAGL